MLKGDSGAWEMSDVASLRLTKLWLLIGWVLILLVFALSLLPIEFELAGKGSDKLSHCMAYGTLMFWFSMLNPALARQLALALAFAAMGIGIEFLQRLTGYRTFEVADMIANSVGVLGGWGVAQTPLGRILLMAENIWDENMKNTILVTGGAGYIGSHTCVELAAAGYEVVIADNLCNSRRSVIDRIDRIAGCKFAFHQGDISDPAFLKEVFSQYRLEAVIHFAGLKAVGESVAKPLLYYDNNVAGTLTLMEAMKVAGVKNMVFSSSATVYGEVNQPPFGEASLLSPTNPYGRSKLMVEWMLEDLARADPGWRIALLRYFNPVGAHISGLIGEDPNGIPNNLMPYVSQVAVGKLKELAVFGNDYPTPDGTGIRDYIHVIDLALGHVAAVRNMAKLDPVNTFNLGTGRGYSVLDVVAAFERAAGLKIPYRIVPRRPGDVPSSYADPARAAAVLGWGARRDLDAMCADAWRWQQWRAAHEAQVH